MLQCKNRNNVLNIILSTQLDLNNKNTMKKNKLQLLGTYFLLDKFCNFFCTESTSILLIWNAKKHTSLGAIQIIRDTFSTLFRPPPPPCDTFYQPLLVKVPVKIVMWHFCEPPLPPKVSRIIWMAHYTICVPAQGGGGMGGGWWLRVRG